jgi:acetylornithine deacetylase
MSGSAGDRALVPTLARMVSVPSVSGRPMLELASMLAERSEDAGMRVERFEVAPGHCNVVARAGPRTGEGLVLSGHLDVVPTDGQDWSTDPFTLTPVGPDLQGRGACDMKGFIAAATCAIESVGTARLNGELAVIWTCEEEVGCAGSRALVDRHRAALADLPPSTVVGEPTGLRVCRMHPGHTTLRITVQGRSAHSSRPELGLNAIGLAAGLLDALRDLEAALRAERRALPELERPWVVLNVGRICGGTAINIVPEHCTIDLGLRPLPGQTAGEMLRRVEDAIAGPRQRATSLGARVELHLLLDAPALLTSPDTPIERALLPLSRSPQVGGVPFATDAGNLHLLGQSCLVYGPGSIDLAHRPDERVPHAELVEAHDQLARLIDLRCRQ